MNHEYEIVDCKVAVFTFVSAEVTLTGTPTKVYTSNDTPMISYVNVHAALNHERSQAKQQNVAGPRALIVGAADTGKSTLCRMLCNYGVRAGHAPMFVDLDINLNSITVAGAIGATVVQHTIGPDSAAETLSVKAPLTYFYGHTSATAVAETYHKLCERLNAAIQKRIDKHANERCSGLIINAVTYGGDAASLAVIQQIAVTFKATVILVIAGGALANEVKSDRITAQIVKLAKSDGVVAKDGRTRLQLRAQSIGQYFYGISRELHPHQKHVSFRDVSIHRIGGGPAAPTSALPIGSKRLIDPNAVVKVNVGLDCQNAIMAVTYATSVETILEANVAGFVYVSEIDMNKKIMTVLTPAPGPLPSMFWLMGNIKWLDT